jgi:hypothetical protein
VVKARRKCLSGWGGGRGGIAGTMGFDNGGGAGTDAGGKGGIGVGVGKVVTCGSGEGCGAGMVGKGRGAVDDFDGEAGPPDDASGGIPAMTFLPELELEAVTGDLPGPDNDFGEPASSSELSGLAMMNPGGWPRRRAPWGRRDGAGEGVDGPAEVETERRGAPDILPVHRNGRAEMDRMDKRQTRVYVNCGMMSSCRKDAATLRGQR